MPDQCDSWFCVVNPHAGSGKTLSEWEKAQKALQAARIPYQTSFTQYKNHARELVAEAASQGYRRFLAIGGDGSVHEVMSGVLSFAEGAGMEPEEFTVGVIPIGSGNDWIRTLGIPHEVGAAVGLLEGPSLGREDVVRVSCTSQDPAAADAERVCYMANIGGVGVDSHVCDRVNALKDKGKRGKLLYLKALLYTLCHAHSFSTRIVADGVCVFEGEAYSVAFGNGRYSGGGMRQVPLAQIDDGLLDYMIVPKAPLLRIFTQLPRLYLGTAHKSSLLLSGRCKTLEMSGENIIELDGEIVGKLPLRICMTGHQVCVPMGNL